MPSILYRLVIATKGGCRCRIFKEVFIADRLVTVVGAVEREYAHGARPGLEHDEGMPT